MAGSHGLLARASAIVSALASNHLRSPFWRALTRPPCAAAYAAYAALSRPVSRYCCEDEVHHKEEARKRAAVDPPADGGAFDSAWRWLVMAGSELAANLAKQY